MRSPAADPTQLTMTTTRPRAPAATTPSDDAAAYVTRVYRYGVPAQASLHGQLSDGGRGQMRLAHQLRNALVDLVRRADDERRAVWGARVDLAEIEAYAEAADRHAAALAVELKRRKSENRTGRADLELAGQLREVRGQRAVLKAEAKALRDLLRPAAQAGLDAVKDRHKAAVKALYGDFVQGRGLYWATFNGVVEDMPVAERRVVADRSAGRPAQLRFRSFAGAGTLTVQLQRGAGQRVTRSQETLHSPTSPWRNVLRIHDPDPATLPAAVHAQKQRLRLRLVTFRAGTASGVPIWETVPVVWHRDLPAGSEVVAAQVVTTRIGPDERLAVCLTVRMPAPKATSRTGLVAVDLGWRLMRDGSVRVAVWRGRPDVPVRLPAAHRGAVLLHGTDGGEVRIPAVWFTGAPPGPGHRGGVKGWQKIDDLRAIRAKTLDRLRHALVGAWEEAPWLTEVLARQDRPGPSRAEIATWQSPGRFLALHQQISGLDRLLLPGPLPDAVLLDLAAFAAPSGDRHLWAWEAHQSASLIARRRDLYRTVAAMLARSFGAVVLESGFAAQLRRRPGPADDSDPQAARARAVAHRVAPAELAAILDDTFAREGCQAVRVPGAGSSAAHHGCGGKLDPEDRRKSVLVVCPACGRQIDQDGNAAWNLEGAGWVALAA